METKKTLWLVSDAVFLGILVYLFYDALHTTWSFDIVHDVFYANITGPVFENAHASSTLMILGVGFYKLAPTVMKVGQPTRWSLAILGTASVHELLLDVVKVVGGIGYFDASNYVAYLSGFLILAFILCSPYQRRVILVASAFLLAFYVVTAALFFNGLNWLDYAPPYLYNFTANAVQVIGWLVPAVLWLLPERWFRWKSLR